MKTRLAATAVAVTLALLASPHAHSAEPNDANAKALAQHELDAQGGKSWEKARYLTFDFVVDTPTRKAGPFKHAWDRYTGRYRVEVPGEKGYVAFFDVNAPKDLGKAVILQNGTRVTGEAAAKLLESAYGRFINDSYWLLAPLKVLDPGVNVADEGEGTFDGKPVRVLRLSFGNVGLTPGDVYRHFLDPKTSAMLGWEYQLQETQPPPTQWRWTEVKDFQGLKLSTVKTTLDGTKTIRLENVSVAEKPDGKLLTPPAP
jgi:hypothetical protein